MKMERKTSKISVSWTLFYGLICMCIFVGISGIESPCMQCERSQKCKPPNCVCCGKDMPLPTAETPQMVFFTFDDAVNTHIAGFYRQLFDSNRKNPNGCPISMTLFISHANTVYTLVREFYQKGMEIASHSVSHSHPSMKTFRNEALKQKQNLARMARIPSSKIKGWRSPFLEPLGDAQPNTLKSLGYAYDATLTVGRGYRGEKAPKPFTLDYGWPYDCKIKPCPRRSHRGFWEVPVISLKDYLGKYECVYVDGCNNPPPDEESAFNFLWENFLTYYKTNKAPFGINMHAAWFYHPDRLKAMDRFIKELVKLDDVYIVSVKQVIAWLQKPTPLQSIHKLEAWGCNQMKGNSSAFHLRNQKIQLRIQQIQQSNIQKENTELIRRHREWRDKQNAKKKHARLHYTSRYTSQQPRSHQYGWRNDHKPRSMGNLRPQMSQFAWTSSPSMTWQSLLAKYTRIQHEKASTKKSASSNTFSKSNIEKQKERQIKEHARIKEQQRLAKEQRKQKELADILRRKQEQIEKEKLLKQKQIEEEKRKAEKARIIEERQKAKDRMLAEKARIEARRIAEQKRIYHERQRAERRRKEEERRIAEQKRKVELRRIVEENRRAEMQRIAEEKRQAEIRRIAEEKRKAELRRIAEEKRQAETRRVAEEKRKAEIQRIAEEKRRAEIRRIAEVKRKAEIQRIAEEKRQAEIRRIAEEKRKAEIRRIAEEKRKAEQLQIEENKRKENQIKMTMQLNEGNSPTEKKRVTIKENILDQLHKNTLLKKRDKIIEHVKHSKQQHHEIKHLPIKKVYVAKIKGFEKPMIQAEKSNKYIGHHTNKKSWEKKTSHHKKSHHRNLSVHLATSAEKQKIRLIGEPWRTWYSDSGALEVQEPWKSFMVQKYIVKSPGRKNLPKTTQKTTPKAKFTTIVTFMPTTKSTKSILPTRKFTTFKIPSTTKPPTTIKLTTTSTTTKTTTTITTTQPTTTTPTTKQTSSTTTLRHTSIKDLVDGLSAVITVKAARNQVELPSGVILPKSPVSRFKNRYYTKTSSVPSTTSSTEASTTVGKHCQQEVNCMRPSCVCETINAPPGLDSSKIPQIVYITIEGDINFLSYSKMRSIFTRYRQNPNGCRISGTFFASDMGTSYRLAHILQRDGIEIGLNGIRSTPYKNGSEISSDIELQMKRMSNFIGMDTSKIKGWRTPDMISVGNKQFEAVRNHSMYDATLISGRSFIDNAKIWPYTLDYGWSEACMEGTCPQGYHPGVWEVPVIPLMNLDKTSTCKFADKCAKQPRTAIQTEKYLTDNFNSYYYKNRAPFGIHLSQKWFYWIYNRNLSGLSRFLDKISRKRDVYIVSISKMLDWMKAPVSLENIGKLREWNC